MDLRLEIRHLHRREYNQSPATMRRYVLGSKVVILVGEFHEYKTVNVGPENLFPRMQHPYDAILAQVEREEARRLDRQLLILTESSPTDVMLQGGEDGDDGDAAYDAEVFTNAVTTPILFYIAERAKRMEDKYMLAADLFESRKRAKGPLTAAQDAQLSLLRHRVRSANIDIRDALRIHRCMLSKVKREVIETANGGDVAVTIAKAEEHRKHMLELLQGAEWFLNDPFFVAERREDLSSFFGSEDMPTGCPCTLQSMCKYTQKELALLQSEALKLPQPNTGTLKDYIASMDLYGSICSRIMDLYALEYILRCKRATTIVVFAGASHTKFIGNALAALHGFRLDAKEVQSVNEAETSSFVFPGSAADTGKSIGIYNDTMQTLFALKVIPPQIVQQFVYDETHPALRIPLMAQDFGTFEMFAVKAAIDERERVKLERLLRDPLMRPQFIARVQQDPGLRQRIQELGLRVVPQTRT